MRHEQLFSPMKVPSALAEGQSSLHQRRARPGPYFVRLLRQCRTERPPMANRTGRKRQLADSRAGFSCPLPGAELCRRRERQRGRAANGGAVGSAPGSEGCQGAGCPGGKPPVTRREGTASDGQWRPVSGLCHQHLESPSDSLCP